MTESTTGAYAQPGWKRFTVMVPVEDYARLAALARADQRSTAYKARHLLMAAIRTAAETPALDTPEGEP